MKYYLLIILIALTNIVTANEGLSYSSVWKGIRLLDTKNIKGVPCVAFYIKSIKKVDFAKANFRIVSPTGKVEKLATQKLSNIPNKELNHEDLDFIEEGFDIKIWLPKNKKKYKNWILNHDFEKGSLDLRFAKMLFSSESIEKKRKEYTKKAEQVVAPDGE